MKHRIFTILCALSLLLFGAVLALWAVRSYMTRPWGIQPPVTNTTINSTYLVGGYVERRWEIRSPVIHTKFNVLYRVAVDSQTLQFDREYWSPTSQFMDTYPLSSWRCIGFRWDSGPAGFGSHYPHHQDIERDWTPVSQRWTLSIPYWFLLVLFAIMPSWFVLAPMNRRRREKRGHCPTCDYDLRASKERCPECGTPIAPANAAEPPLAD